MSETSKFITGGANCCPFRPHLLNKEGYMGRNKLRPPPSGLGTVLSSCLKPSEVLGPVRTRAAERHLLMAEHKHAAALQVGMGEQA